MKHQRVNMATTSRFKLNKKHHLSDRIVEPIKMIRFCSENNEDNINPLVGPYSFPNNYLTNNYNYLTTNNYPTKSQHSLNRLLKRGVTQRKKVLRNLYSQLNRQSAQFHSSSHKRLNVSKGQKQKIKKSIRNCITGDSSREKREYESSKKMIRESFNKVVKDLKRRNYARWVEENQKNKVKIESFGATIKGDKHGVNQDSIAFSEGIYIICDGHGVNGKEISQFVSQTAHKLFVESFKEKKMDTHHIRTILKKTQVELDISGIDIAFSGCTFLAIIIYENKIFSISLGDSKVILCHPITTAQVCVLHKPDAPIERARIEATGALIHPIQIGKDKYSGPNRIWAPGKNSWGPGLALSRAFGDKAAKKYGLISEPDIRNIHLTYEAEFIVLGSDGLYDVMKDNQISFFIRKKLKQDGGKRQTIALHLAQEAKRLGFSQSDDISCIIILL